MGGEPGVRSSLREARPPAIGDGAAGAGDAQTDRAGDRAAVEEKQGIDHHRLRLGKQALQVGRTDQGGPWGADRRVAIQHRRQAEISRGAEIGILIRMIA